MSRMIGKKRVPSLKTLEDFIAILRAKYGPTFTVDMNKGERAALVALRSEINFLEVVADGVTCDLLKGSQQAA